MEEFSFPAIAAAAAAEQNTLCKLPSHFTSTPTWFLSSPSNHKPALHLNYQRSRSFSCLEDLKLRDEMTHSTEINHEESMDMLWEDFNEELRQIACDEKAGEINGLKLSKKSDKLDGKKGNASRELFCVKAVHHHQRPGLLMIFKVFKKLLFIQKTRKKRTSSSVVHHM